MDRIYKINAVPADISIYTKNGLRLCEKSCIAYERDSKKIKAYGNEAWEMLGKDESIVVESPLQEGHIVLYVQAERLFQWMVKQVRKSRLLRVKEMAVILEQEQDSVFEKALEQAFYQAGVNKIEVMLSSKYRTEQDYMSLAEKYELVVVIGKNEPKEYVWERLRSVIAYARERDITEKELVDLWENCLK